MQVAFSPRPEEAAPLAPSAVVGVGDAGRRLAARLLEEDDRSLAQLQGVTTRDALLLLGALSSLYWVDGVVYLGRDPDAPLLLLPTQLVLDAPLSDFERAVVRASGLETPIAVLPQPPMLVSVAAARAVDRALLERWYQRSP